MSKTINISASVHLSVELAVQAAQRAMSLIDRGTAFSIESLQITPTDPWKVGDGSEERKIIVVHELRTALGPIRSSSVVTLKKRDLDGRWIFTQIDTAMGSNDLPTRVKNVILTIVPDEKRNLFTKEYYTFGSMKKTA